jgi:hypothetical protein
MSNRCNVVLLFSLLFSSFAIAQTSLSGAIEGTAWDAQHAAVPEARITLLNPDTGEHFEAVSGANGAFRIVELRPGSYALNAQRPGFAAYRAHVIVEVGRITEVEIPFAVAGARESIEVRDEVPNDAPSVNTSQPDFATNFDLSAIENLPINDRRWWNFALLTPTATLDGDYGLISFRGISGLLNSSTIDGADNNQAFFSEERGRSRISYVISQEAVREFQINTSNFSAQYGRSAGAVVNAVTRSGGNELHGMLLAYDRDNALGAANAFAVTPVEQPGGNWTTAKIKPLDRRLQFGANLGGPILKDKLFYFLNFDAQHRDYPAVAAAADTTSLFAHPCVIRYHYLWMDPVNQPNVRICTYDELYTLTRNVMPLYTSDAAAIRAFNSGIGYLAGLLGPVPRTADHDVAFSKIDYHIAQHQVLGLTYNRMRWSSPNGAQSLPVVNLGTDSFGLDGVKVDMLTALLTSTIGNHTVSQLRYSWSRDFEYEMPQPPTAGQPSVSNAYFPAVSVLGDSTGFTFGTPATMPRRALPDELRNQLAETVNWIHGRHAFKFGFDSSIVHDEMNNLYAADGSYKYYYRDNFIADLYQWQNNTGTQYRGYSTFTQGFGTAAFAFNSFDGAAFVQDDWRALPRLTLSFGLRYDIELLPNPQIPNPQLPATSSFPSDNNNFGPRFGFALNLTGDSKTALRGGYGIYYARISNSTISSAISNTGTQPAQRSYSYRPCYMWDLTCLNGPIFPLVSSPDPFSSSQGGSVAVFAPNMRTPQIHQADLIIERQVAHNAVLTASYLLSLGRELPNFIDINLDPASRSNVTYTFAADYDNGAPGPYLGHTLTVPVYTARLNPNFQTITQIRSNVNSSYNALVLEFNRSSTRALAFKFNYTWSHALDYGQNSTTFTTYSNTLSPVPFTYLYDGVPHYVSRPDYGNSNYDIRQRLTGSLSWAPSFFRHSNRLLHATLDHWSLAPTMHLATGKPFSDRVTGDSPIDTYSGTGTTQINNCAGCDGFMGTGGQYRLPFLGRNSFRNGNFYNVDLRLARRISFGERHNLEILAEAFNLFNHQNITSRDEALYSTYNPTTSSNNSTLDYNSNFNTPTAAASTVYRERELQLGLRYHF